MPNPSLAIIRTVPQRLLSSWLPPLITTCYLVMALGPLFFQQANAQRFNYCLLSGTALFVGAVAFHAKQIVLDAKRRSLPGAPRVPMTVAGVIVGLYLVAMPLLVHLYRPEPLLSQTAVIWLLAACTVHSVVRQFLLSGAVVILAFTGTYAAGTALQIRIAGIIETPSIAWLLLAISSALLVLSIVQLYRMTEESPGYEVIGQRQPDWSAPPASTGEATQPWSDPTKAKWLALGAPAGRSLHRATQPGAADTLWNHCRRWRAVNQRSSAIWVLTLVMGGMMLFSMRGLAMAGDKQLWTFLPAAMVVPMILMLTVVHYLQQWRFRATDLLKPQRREDFLREMGLCLAMDLLRNLFITGVLLGALAILLAPAPLPQIHPQALLQLFLLAASAMVLIFGVLVWVLRYRLIAAVGLLFPVLILPAVAMSPAALSTSTVLLIAAGLTLAGLLLTRSAYRRWLLTDLA